MFKNKLIICFLSNKFNRCIKVLLSIPKYFKNITMGKENYPVELAKSLFDFFN